MRHDDLTPDDELHDSAIALMAIYQAIYEKLHVLETIVDGRRPKPGPDFIHVQGPNSEREYQ
jgi:hypothetical protein